MERVVALRTRADLNGRRAAFGTEAESFRAVGAVERGVCHEGALLALGDERHDGARRRSLYLLSGQGAALTLGAKLLQQGGDCGTITFEERDGACHAKVLLRTLNPHSQTRITLVDSVLF
jgi:hypothetical protein